MNFANLPVWGIGAGLAALAGGLFVLQMLRVRHRQLEVPTTMFWKEAVEESRARVLRQRFRHPWAYLLLLLIAALLWLAIGGLQSSASDRQEYLLVLDGSVGMSHPERFEIATDSLLQDAENLPAANREVWWSGAETKLLLAKGEHTLLLRERLKDMQPDMAAAAVEDRLLQMAKGVDQQRSLQVRLYGDAPLRNAAREQLPSNFEVLRCTPLAPAQAGNRGFISGGIQASESGQWDHVDLIVEIIGTTEAPTLTSSGAKPESPAASVKTALGTQWRFTEILARGQVLELQIATQDNYPADDRISIAVPQRRPLQVLLSDSLASTFAPLVMADSALVMASDSADLVVRLQGENLGAALPALEISSAAASTHAFEITDAGSGTPEQLLRSIHQQLGFAEIDALALAQQLQQPISLGVELGDTRKVQVWDQLLDPKGAFASSRSFPLFMGRSLRWLANTHRYAPFAVTGRPLSFANGNWTTPQQGTAVTAGLALRPTVAGVYRSSEGNDVAANAFDTRASLGLAAFADVTAGEALQASTMPLWSWLVLLVLLLLGVEWMLFHNGRIP